MSTKKPQNVSSTLFKTPQNPTNISRPIVTAAYPPLRSQTLMGFDQPTALPMHYSQTTRRMPMSSYSRYPTYNSYGSLRRYGGMYPNYGGYGMPYRQYPNPNDPFNSFIQMAEESTRPAFESIESVVDVVGSISMMLESTYQAVYSSYSAIIGVVDQFSRLKDHFIEIFSVLRLLRWLRWLCLKVLYLLKLKKGDPSVDTAWNSAQNIGGQSEIFPFGAQPKSSAWPFLMFIGLVIGAPWLMFKLLSKSVQTKAYDEKLFYDDHGNTYKAVAKGDFTAQGAGQLTICKGEEVYVCPKALRGVPKGWLYICTSKAAGLVPTNSVRWLKSQSQVPPTSAPVRKSDLPEDLADVFERHTIPSQENVATLPKVPTTICAMNSPVPSIHTATHFPVSDIASNVPHNGSVVCLPGANAVASSKVKTTVKSSPVPDVVESLPVPVVASSPVTNDDIASLPVTDAVGSLPVTNVVASSQVTGNDSSVAGLPVSKVAGLNMPNPADGRALKLGKVSLALNNLQGLVNIIDEFPNME